MSLNSVDVITTLIELLHAYLHNSDTSVRKNIDYRNVPVPFLNLYLWTKCILCTYSFAPFE